MTVNAKWPANYHMVFHYALNDSEEATGRVVVRHADGRRVTQDSLVTFKPTVNGSAVTGQFVLVSENGSPTQFALLDGQYDIEFTTKSKKLLLVGGRPHCPEDPLFKELLSYLMSISFPSVLVAELNYRPW